MLDVRCSTFKAYSPPPENSLFQQAEFHTRGSEVQGISAKLFCKCSHAAIMPYGVVLKDERRKD